MATNTGLGGVPATALAIGPVTPTTLYAGGNRVFKSMGRCTPAGLKTLPAALRRILGRFCTTAEQATMRLDDSREIRTALGCQLASALRWRCGGRKSCDRKAAVSDGTVPDFVVPASRSLIRAPMRTKDFL